MVSTRTNLEGFTRKIYRVERKNCSCCSEKIDKTKFKTTEHLVEFKLSGLCETCQDKIFGKRDIDDDRRNKENRSTEDGGS